LYADSSDLEDPIDLKDIVTYRYSMRPSVNLTELSLMILGINSTSTNGTMNENNDATSENNTESESNVTPNGTRRLNSTDFEALE
jgi:hypothetical protein